MAYWAASGAAAYPAFEVGQTPVDRQVPAKCIDGTWPSVDSRVGGWRPQTPLGLKPEMKPAKFFNNCMAAWPATPEPGRRGPKWWKNTLRRCVEIYSSRSRLKNSGGCPQPLHIPHFQRPTIVTVPRPQRQRPLSDSPLPSTKPRQILAKPLLVESSNVPLSIVVRWNVHKRTETAHGGTTLVDHIAINVTDHYIQ